MREVTQHTVTQCDMVLDHMKKHGSITQLEAVREYGCYRLSARISDLRNRGISITTDRVKRKNRSGHVVTFAKYILAEE